VRSINISQISSISVLGTSAAKAYAGNGLLIGGATGALIGGAIAAGSKDDQTAVCAVGFGVIGGAGVGAATGGGIGAATGRASEDFQIGPGAWRIGRPPPPPAPPPSASASVLEIDP
jgi:hypothetical protein